MTHSYQDYLDGLCTQDAYRAQFNPLTLKVNSVYIQAKGTWHEKHFLILKIDGNVAFAKSVYNKISNKYIGDYAMFLVNDGFQYNDTRPVYRLSEEIVNK